MKARNFPLSDHKNKQSRWDIYYSQLNMDAYLRTLEYDEVTDFLDQHLAGLPRDAPILDVGCGPGRHMVHLANRGFTSLHGVDLSLAGVSSLKRFRPQMNVQVADATRLPYPDGSFAAVVMVGIVYEIPDPTLHESVFREIRRVLRPEGKLIFINNSPYHLGERIFTLTQALSNLAKREPTRFFVWRYERRDVRRVLAASGLRLEKETAANVARGVFRFLYGVFVPREVKNGRKRRVAASQGQPYDLHEYYLVLKDPSLLTAAGRMAVRLSRRYCPHLFANSICHLIGKPMVAQAKREGLA